MSLPKRYSIRGFSAAIVEEDNGVMVKYSDYELLRQEFSLLAEERYTTIRALELENERLTKERNHYQWASTNDGIACNERARENQDLENQIADLKAENERLTKETNYEKSFLMETDRLHAEFKKVLFDQVIEKNAALQAENERLRKAGDAMANVLCFTLGLSGEEPRFVKDWLAAKETQP
jgi:hypothetical protein